MIRLRQSMNKKEPQTAKWELVLKIFLAVVLLFAGVKFLFFQGGVEITSGRDAFASCLSQKGVKMFGSDTCEYCREQKKMFGASFGQIPYVNCDFDKQICQEKGITVYPVWEIDDKLSAGIKTFDQLSQATGCVAPN